MKIELTKPQVELVKEWREDIANGIKNVQGSNSAIEKLELTVKTLEEEIPAIEAELDLTDSAAVQSLETKRTQLRLAKEKLASIPVNRAECAALGGILNNACNAVCPLLRPVTDKYLNEIVEAMIPFYRTRDVAIGAAKSSDAFQGFVNKVLSRARWTALGNDIERAKWAVKFCDSLLAGEIPFEFRPQDSGAK